MMHGSFRKACLAFAGLVVMALTALLCLAWLSSKWPPWEQRLAALPAEERATLDEAVKAAGLSISDLRDVGLGAPLEYKDNFRSIALENGHVLMLSLQTGCEPLPSLSAWKFLERLSLRGAHLSALPDLSGCVRLQALDASNNRIASLVTATLPPGLQTVDLSENPLEDLAPLAELGAAREIHLRKAAVHSFEALIDLPLRLLDLRENPISRLPDRLPKSADFQVDLDGCPVSTPPGYRRDLEYTIKESGAPGGVQTAEGALSSGKFQASGAWREVPHFTKVSLPGMDDASLGVVNVEVRVEQGRLRIYVGESEESRGPWFARGFVKGAGRFVRAEAFLYADAEPGRPARLRGNLAHLANQPYFLPVEPLDERPAIGMKYRVWRD